LGVAVGDELAKAVGAAVGDGPPPTTSTLVLVVVIG